jgi:hypothetical protein
MAGGKSGGDAYWPGFVDALTNVVIAMIFVVVVLAIALAFAAQMMGKKLAERYIKEHEAQVAAKAAPAPPSPPEALPLRESALPRQRIAVAGAERASAPPSAKLQSARNTLQLDFAPNALTLDEAAAQQFKAAIATAVAAQATRRVQILARGPAMSLSDNQRAAYLRVMATRNVLLESGISPDHIEVRIDTEHDAASASVNVSFTE